MEVNIHQRTTQIKKNLNLLERLSTAQKNIDFTENLTAPLPKDPQTM